MVELDRPSELANECAKGSFVGFVLNIPVVEENILKRMVLPKNRRHWLAIVKAPSEHQCDSSGIAADQTWIVLDSESRESIWLSSTVDLISFLSDKKRTDCAVLKATSNRIA